MVEVACALTAVSISACASTLATGWLSLRSALPANQYSRLPILQLHDATNLLLACSVSVAQNR